MGGAYREVRDVDVSKSANVINSRVVYKVKTEKGGRLRVKARICPHGNCDFMEDDVRKESSTAQFYLIRIMPSIATFTYFRPGGIDFKGAYLQSGQIVRQIYVRTLVELSGWKRGSLWALLKLPYEIAEAGRQWAMDLED